MANEDDLEKKWGQVPDDVDVLISHGPPYTVLDLLIKGGEQAGSIDHHDRVLLIEPTLNVFGHIHEAYGQEHYAGIDFINCSLLNFSYEMVNQPVAYTLKDK